MRPAVIPLRQRGPIPASLTQERFWFIDQLNPDTAVHNLAYGIDIEGRLDTAGVDWALRQIVQRHDILRVRFSLENSSLWQRFTDTAPTVSHLELLGRDLTALTRELGTAPFDYFNGPLARMAIIRSAPERHRLVLVAHHTVFDGWSLGVFLTEFAALYRARVNGEPSPLPDLEIQYGDYATWQRTTCEAGSFDPELAYWTEELGGEPQPLLLPTDFPRPQRLRFHGRSHRFTIPARLADAVKDLAAEEAATPFMAWLALFQVLLYRETGHTTIRVGGPVANRPDQRLEPLIGPFLNVLVFRGDLTGDPTFRQFLSRVRRNASDAISHQELPFQKVVEHLDRHRAGLRLFQAALAFQPAVVPDLDLGADLSTRAFAVDTETAQNDLSLFLTPTRHGLDALVQYASDLFRRDTIERIFTDFTRLAWRLVKDPDLPVDRLLRRGGIARPEPIDRSEPVPLSYAQQHWWAAEQTAPGDPAWKVAIELQLRGRLRIDRLRTALGTLQQRHEALRTKVSLIRDQACQVVSPPGEVPLCCQDLSGHDAPHRTAAIQDVTAAALAEPFNLSTETPMRAHLFTLSDTQAVLLLVLHRTAADEQSTDLLVHDLLAGYRIAAAGEIPPVPTPGIQVAEHALSQRRALGGRGETESEAYWRKTLAQLPELLELPARPATATRPTTRTTELPFSLGTEPSGLLNRSGDLRDALLAGLAVLLARYTGQPDIGIAVRLANRPDPDLERVVGCFADIRPVAVRVDQSQSFRELLAQVQGSLAAADAHQKLPFHRVAGLRGGPHHPGRHPLCQVLFDFGAAPVRRLETAGLEIQVRRPGSGATEFDLTAELERIRDGALGGQLRFRTDLLDPQALAGLSGHFAELLTQFAANPDAPISRASTLSPPERARVLSTLDATETETVAENAPTLHGCLEWHAAQRPDTPAVIHDANPLTYRQFNAWANRIAHGLLGLGVTRGQPVPLVMHNSALAVAAMFGVLKAGAAFCCLDPVHPTAHIDRMLRHLDPDLVLVDLATAHRHPGLAAATSRHARVVTVLGGDAGPDPDGDRTVSGGIARHFTEQPATDPGLDMAATDPAYLAHTSGSTGAPKGIPHPHRSLTQFTGWQSREFGVGPGQRMGQLAALSFDVAYCEIFGALCHGATLCVRPDVKGDPLELAHWLRDHRVTHLQVIPRLFREIVRALDAGGDLGDALTALRTVLFVGEPLPTDLVTSVRRSLGARLRLVNVYGPTEVVAATFHPVDQVPAETPVIPIGRPIPGRHLLILDEAGQPCPPGVAGEIWIRSRHLTAGYHGDEAETLRRFRVSPIADVPGRLYRTGDLGRLRRDGTLEFAGRADNQVKLSGVRLELEAVEAAVSAHPGVRECVAVVRADGGGQRLVAYVTTEPDHTVDDLRERLASTVPAHMVPGQVIPVDSLPRTASGKVDRKALLAISPEQPRGGRYVPPGTPLESHLAELAGEVLGVDRVGVTDDFFELGGNSLQATRFVNRIREIYGIDVALQSLLAEPTVEATAAALEKAQRDPGHEAQLARIERELAHLTDDEVRSLLAQGQALSAESKPGSPDDDATAPPAPR